MKNWLNNISRMRGEDFPRSKYLRLDKNERVINFPNSFLNLIKKKSAHIIYQLILILKKFIDYFLKH